MTTIAFDGEVLAVDSRVSGRYVLPWTVSKMCRVKTKSGEELYVTSQGARDAALLFRKWLEAGAAPNDYPDLCRDDNFNFIGVTLNRKGTICEYAYCGYPVLELTGEKYALGSGLTYAYGAMWAGADAKTAVEIACVFDEGSGLPVHVYRPDELQATDVDGGPSLMTEIR